MNPWIIIALVCAAVVFALDYLVRRKKWEDNTKDEKISLVLNMFSISVYIFASVLGMLLGIVAGGEETAFGKVLGDVTLELAGTYWIVASAAAVGSFILRKIEKTKASIWVNVIALAYIVIVLGLNYFAGEVL